MPLPPFFLRVTDCIGGGNFGTVYKGLWQVPGGTVEVAVKTLNPESQEINEIKFLREAAIMGQFLHPNVVKLLGVVTVGEPVSRLRVRVIVQSGQKVWSHNIQNASVSQSLLCYDKSAS